MTITLVAADDIPIPPDDGLPPGQPYVSPDDLASIPPLFAEAAGQVLLPLVAEIWQNSAGTVHAQLVDAANLPSLPAVSSLAAETYLAQAANTFAQVGDDLWATARSELLAGFEAGESIPQLADRLRGSAGLTARKATLVARTQVLDASNAGSYATAQTSGIDLRKGWLDTPDNRTRETHRLAGAKYGADQQMIPMADQFVVGGYSCDRPHDPTLPPAETFNCRCTLIYSMGEQAVREAQDAATPPAPLPNTSGQNEPPPLPAVVEPPKAAGALTGRAAQDSAPVRWDYGPRNLSAGLDDWTANDRAEATRVLHNWVYDKVSYDRSRAGLLTESNPEAKINAAIRGKVPMSEQLTTDVRIMDRILDDSPLPQPVIAYRGFVESSDILPENWQGGDLAGVEWRNKGYTSITVDRDAAETYSGFPEQGGFAIRMRLPARSRAISIQDEIGGADDEGEMILPRGSSFRVLKDNGIQGNYGIRWLDVEVDSPSPRSLPRVGGPESALSGRTVVQLRALAKQRGVPGYSKLTKPQLLERLAARPAVERRAIGEIPVYRPPVSLSAEEQARATRLVRADPQILATVQDRFGRISTSGNLTEPDAAWLQTVFEREPAFINRLAQEAGIGANLRRAAKNAGETPAVFNRQVADKLRGILENKPIAVRVSDEAALRGILTEGRFRTQFDEGTRRAGDLTADLQRRRLGEQVIGVDPDLTAAQRPVYGYVSVNGVEPALSAGRKIPGIAQREGAEDVLSQYGRIQVVLKPEVRARTTATVGDSLDQIGFTRPSPIDAPDAFSARPGYSFKTGDLDQLTEPGWTRREYVEAQIHGGIRLDDIAEVVFPDEPSAALKTALAEKSIRWRVLRPGDRPITEFPVVEQRVVQRAAARERNRIIEQRAAAEQTLAELDDLLVKKASREAFEQRIAAATLDPKDLAALRAALGDPVKLRAQVTRITKKQGITVQARSGAKVKFDPALHDPVGEIPPAGTPVVVIRRGTTVTVDGDTIVLNRAVVRLPVAPVKRAPAKAKAAADKAAPRPDGGVADIERGAQVRDRIRDAYRAVKDETGIHGRGSPYVTLADLRRKIGDDIPRHEVDEQLRLMNRDGRANVVPETNSAALTQADHDAAIAIGGTPKHAVSIKDLRRETEPTTAVEPNMADPDRDIRVRNAIREAYARVDARTSARGYVTITDLRRELGDRYPRAEVDQQLRVLGRGPSVDIFPESNQKMLTPEDRETAVIIGNQPKHTIRMSNTTSEPVAADAQDAKRAPTKAVKAAPKKAPTPSDPRVAALPRTAGKPPTPAKAAKATNPKFGSTQQGPTYRDAGKAGKPYRPDMGPLPSGAFEENCSNAIQAFEMRMRGFNVEAAPLDVLDKYGYSAGRTFGELDQLLTDAWRLPDGSPHGRSFAGQAWRSFAQIDEEIDRTWPDGGRGFIFVGKHIFNVVKVRGKPVYYEAQFDANTTRNVTALYRRKYGGPSGQAKLFRVDDLEPVGGILDTITPI